MKVISTLICTQFSFFPQNQILKY